MRQALSSTVSTDGGNGPSWHDDAALPPAWGLPGPGTLPTAGMISTCHAVASHGTIAALLIVCRPGTSITTSTLHG